MHELSLATTLIAILEDLIKEHKAKNVKDVFVRVGSFSCVNSDSLRFAFDALKKERDTIKDAKLHIREIPSMDEIVLEKVDMEV